MYLFPGPFPTSNILRLLYVSIYCLEDVQYGFSDLEMREGVVWKRTQPHL